MDATVHVAVLAINLVLYVYMYLHICYMGIYYIQMVYGCVRTQKREKRITGEVRQDKECGAGKGDQLLLQILSFFTPLL
jgi:hypothetical protein